MGQSFAEDWWDAMSNGSSITQPITIILTIIVLLIGLYFAKWLLCMCCHCCCAVGTKEWNQHKSQYDVD